MLKANCGSSLEQPKWLQILLSERFFNACPVHPTIRKNERNIICLDCAEGMCTQCACDDHHGHKFLQIRRYVYHDVLRVQDINKLLDCSGVQTYIVNSCRVVFLNQRPQPRPTKNQNACETCARTLQDEYSYCCLGCKVEAIYGSAAPTARCAQASTSQPASPVSGGMSTNLDSPSHEHSMHESRQDSPGSSPARDGSQLTSDSGSFMSEDGPEDDVMAGYLASSGGEGGSDQEQFSPFDSMPVPKRSRNGRKESQMSPKSVLPCVRRRKSSTPQRSPAF